MYLKVLWIFKINGKRRKRIWKKIQKFPIIKTNNENKNLNDIKHFDEDNKISKNNIITKEKLWR